MHLLSYTSVWTGSPDSIELELVKISSIAQKQNPLFNICGVLFYHGGRFLQLLEGPEEQVRQLMKNISIDPRHTDIRVIIDRKTAVRSFPSWNMDTFNLDTHQHLDLEILAECASLFNSTPEANAEHFVQALRIVLHCSQLHAISS
jgi:hypothetical protein